LTRTLLLAVLLAAAALAFVVLAPRAAHWLIRARPIDRCDLMIVPGGGALERIGAAVDLISGGTCGKVLFTGSEPPEGLRFALPFLEELPPSASVPAPFTARDTFEDAIVALRVARAGGFRDVLVVTSPYHSRRTAWIFARVFAGSGVRVGVYPSGNFYMDYDRWWNGRHGRSMILLEYVKLWLCGLVAEGVRAQAAGAATVM